jgi:hypothetical protein
MNKTKRKWERHASKALQLLALFPTRPVEAYDRLMTFVEVNASRGQAALGKRNALVFTEMLSLGLGISRTDISKILAENELRDLEGKVSAHVAMANGAGPFDLGHNGNFCLARSIYVLCRVLSPNIVLETGVAYGVTSAFTLQALAVNRKGGLVSVDLPPLGRDADRHVGMLIPQNLRDRWCLHRGPAKRILPHLITSIREIDVFVHDSLHTYRHMNFEFETAWPCICPGGVLVADNVDLNDAFVRFAARVNPAYSALAQEDNTTDLFGMMIKRS